MANRILPATLLLALAAGACGGTEAGEADAAAEAPASAADVPRTGDPYARGFTDADFPRVQRLADGVYSYEQLRSAGDEGFTTVSLIVVGSDGVLVADGQGSVEETRRLVEAVDTLADGPITHVVVSSDHGDHTGGNSAFPADATVYAHPTSARALEASAANAREGSTPAPLPDELVEERRTLSLGDKEVQLLFLGRAHTGGDLLVYLPEEKVLFMSEAYLNRIFPAMRSAYPSEWVEVLKKAEAMDVDVYVPGHGFVESPEILREELTTYREAVERVIAEATRLHEQGVPVDEAVEQAEFGDLEGWTLRSSQGPTAVRRVYMELDGELPQG